MWHIVFSFCIPTTLFAVRNTCRQFRAIVDRDGGKLLAHAPLLLPHPPPNPRIFLRVYNNPRERGLVREFFGIVNPREKGLYGSVTYTNLMFRSGRCKVCGSWTPGPPEWIHSKLYFCSKDCRVKFFRSEVVYLLPQYNYLPARSAMPKVDRHIVPSLPLLSLSSDLYQRDQKTQAILVDDLLRAREEYQDEVLSVRDAHERRKREKALFELYSARARWARSMFIFQFWIDIWKRKMDGTKRKVIASSLRRLRKYAYKKKISAALAMRYPAVRHPLKTRARDLRRVSRSNLTKAGLSSVRSKKRIHPGKLPLNRLNFETGKAEYRCGACTDYRVKWYTADALLSHEFYKHGIRHSEEEWSGFARAIVTYHARADAAPYISRQLWVSHAVALPQSSSTMSDVPPPPAKIPRTRSPPSPDADLAAFTSPPAAPATASAAQQFTEETWAEIMSHCSVFDLFSLRDVCHQFRAMIDKDVLEDAFKDFGLHLIRPLSALEKALLPVKLRDPICYVKMLCAGSCSVCGMRSALPPVSSDLKVRLCGSEDCSSYLFSDHMSRRAPRDGVRTFPIPGQRTAEVELPEIAKAWQPYMLTHVKRYTQPSLQIMSSDIRNESNCRYVLKARRLTIEELESVGWDGKDLHDIVRGSTDKEGAKRLVSEYERRAECHEVTGRVFLPQNMIAYVPFSGQWSLVYALTPRSSLESRAKSLYKSYDPEHPFVSRVLVAHVRDASRILPPAIDCLISPPDLPKGPWDPELDHVPQCRSSAALPRDFVPFMYRERGEEECDTKVTLAEPTNHERELEIEEAPMSTCEETAIAGRSDHAADLGSSPGGTHDRSGDARKAATSRSSQTRPRTRSAKPKISTWYTCTDCASETRFRSEPELRRHQAKEHSSSSAPAKA
ncbi:hypothetical protein FB107DRAFT_222534 [Schizophyllum commune]